jgi:transposase
VSQNKVAQQLGITTKSLVKWLHKYGSPKPAEETKVKAQSLPGRTPAERGRIRYSPEEKRMMKARAVELRNRGVSQQAAADELGISVQTLRVLLKDTRFPGKAPAKTAGSQTAAKTSTKATDPLMELASARNRLQEIDKELETLHSQRADLQEKAKRLHRIIGEELAR